MFPKWCHTHQRYSSKSGFLLKLWRTVYVNRKSVGAKLWIEGKRIEVWFSIDGGENQPIWLCFQTYIVLITCNIIVRNWGLKTCYFWLSFLNYPQHTVSFSICSVWELKKKFSEKKKQDASALKQILIFLSLFLFTIIFVFFAKLEIGITETQIL